MAVAILPSVALAAVSCTDFNACEGGDTSATDVLEVTNCDVEFEDNGVAGNNTDIGSFDDPDDAGTSRTPLQYRLLTDEPSIGTGSCRLIVYNTQSCAGTTLINDTDTVDGTQEVDVASATFDATMGELCWTLNATADDGVGDPATTLITGRITINPFLNNPTVSDTNINMFQTQTITHNAENAENITNISVQLIRVSDNTSLKSILTDTTPTTSTTEQLIAFSPNPTLNTNHSYMYTQWCDGNCYTRFSTTSLNANSNGVNATTPNFIINSSISCNALAQDDGKTVYNRGHVANRSGTIVDNDGNNWSVTSNVAFNISYQNSSGSTQFSNTSFDISNGAWDRDTSIPANATAKFNFTGGQYSLGLTVFNDGTPDATENLTCTYSNALNISSMLQVSTSSSSIDNSTTINATPKRFNRNEPVNASFFLYDINGTKHSSKTGIFVGFFDNTSTSQVSTSSESTDSNGFLDAILTLPTTATGVNHYLGTPYSIVITDSNNNSVSYNSGTTNGTVSGTFNVSSWYLVNVHGETDSTRTDIYSNNTFPNENTTGELSNAIIAADVIFTWCEVRNARNESLNGKVCNMEFIRPDSTSASEENQTTGSDGWTATVFDFPTSAPSGKWTIFGNVSSSTSGETTGNSGTDQDSFNMISPYTGNLNAICSAQPVLENNYPSQPFQLNDVIYIRCTFRTVADFSFTNHDTDNNVTTVTIYRTNPNGSLTTLFNNVSMTRFDEGVYVYNITLNTSNGFENGRFYDIISAAELDARDVIGKGQFKIAEGAEASIIGGVGVSTTPDKLAVVGDNLLVGARLIYKGTGYDLAPNENIQYRITRFNQTSLQLEAYNSTDGSFENLSVSEESSYWFNLTKLTVTQNGTDNYTWTKVIATNTQNWSAQTYFFNFKGKTNTTTVYDAVPKLILSQERQEIDPKEGWCTPTVKLGQNITCVLELAYLNATPLIGQTPTIQFTFPNGSSTTANMTEIGLGGYRYIQNATVAGDWQVRMNNTLSNVNYATYKAVVIQESFGISSDQNTTLYDIKTNVTAIKNDTGLIYSLLTTLNTFVQTIDTFLRNAWGNYTASTIISNITSNTTSENNLTRYDILAANTSLHNSIQTNFTALKNKTVNINSITIDPDGDQLGETFNIFATVVDYHGNKYNASTVLIQLFNPSLTQVVNTSMTNTETGLFKYEVNLSTTSDIGSYLAVVKASQNGTDSIRSATFEITGISASSSSSSTGSSSGAVAQSQECPYPTRCLRIYPRSIETTTKPHTEEIALFNDGTIKARFALTISTSLQGIVAVQEDGQTIDEVELMPLENRSLNLTIFGAEETVSGFVKVEPLEPSYGNPRDINILLVHQEEAQSQSTVATLSIAQDVATGNFVQAGSVTIEALKKPFGVFTLPEEIRSLQWIVNLLLSKLFWVVVGLGIALNRTYKDIQKNKHSHLKSTGLIARDIALVLLLAIIAGDLLIFL